MARTPLFSRLRTLMRAAQRGDERALQPGRRRFLHAALAGGAAVTAAACASAEKPPEPRPGQPRVAIVGAGVAGLNCAWQLRKQGVLSTVYEASTRTGGRMMSRTDLLGAALVTEIGGEFIDSGHEDMLGLCREFGLELLDMRADKGLAENAWFFGGVHRTDKEIFDALRPLVARLNQDARLTEYEPERARGDAAYARLDETSIRDYLDAIGCSGWLRALLDVAFVTEFGLDTGEQSCMNMLCMLSTEGTHFEPFGESDERFKVRTGNQSVCTELARRVDGSIRLEHRLARVEGPGPYRLTFDTSRGGVTESFDTVVLALPFTILRDIDLQLELPAEKRKAIRELGYGRNGKIVLGMQSRPWRVTGYSGAIFSDEPFQLAWDNSRMQWGKDANPVAGPAGLTLYSGGSLCDAAAVGTPEQQIERLLPRLELAFPNVRRAYSGRNMRMHWPSEPRVLASYACYRPGQWSQIRGHEAEAVGDLLFAGEHCSLDSQGYMNGGAETGRMAAERILAKLPR